MSEMTITEAGGVRIGLAEACTLHQPADALIRNIYEKRVAWGALQTAYQQKVRSAYATVKADPFAGTAWQRLLNHLGHRTGLLTVEPVVPSLGPQPGNTYIDALLMLALRHEAWSRPLEAWRPETPVARQQFGALARHLLTDYYVPAFLDAAWFEGFTAHGEQHRNWFLHIGGGQNIRTADVPVRLTKMAAHHFLQAPDEISIVAALRWGQTLGLGGDAYLARAIAGSRLGSILPDEPFWASVIHLFVNNPTMDTAWVGPIVDYVYTQKFGEQAIDAPNQPKEFSDAPEPEFTMKGRTLAALHKRVQEWHEQLARETKRPRTVWDASGIAPLQAEERDMHGMLNTWTILELLNSRALMEEGREMKHCVFTYASGCLNGTTSIWSLRVRSIHDARQRRMLTIEVNNARRAIVQVRGRCNLTLGSYRGNGRMRTAGEILRRWAQEQRLSIACSL
jgi:hypothetical protein